MQVNWDCGETFPSVMTEASCLVGRTSAEVDAKLSVLGTCERSAWPEILAKKLIHRTTQGRWGLSVLDFAVGS